MKTFIDSNAIDHKRRYRSPNLPTYYYLDNFNELLEFVSTYYQHVLLANHNSFINEFNSLSKDAKCLFIRLVNRKGYIFSKKILKYEEIGSISNAAEELNAKGFINALNIQECNEILHFLTKDQLCNLVPKSTIGFKRSWKKSDCIIFIGEKVAPKEIIEFAEDEGLVKQARTDDVEYLQFLYYGKLFNGTSQSTLRDLGIVQTNSNIESFEPRFNDYDEAYENYYYTKQLEQIKCKPTNTVRILYGQVDQWPDPVTNAGAVLRDELALKLGKLIEKQKDNAKALEVYQRGESTKCTQQVVRLFIARNQREAAKDYLETLIDYPRTDEEKMFAIDLYERKFNKKKRSLRTETLIEAETIELDLSLSGSPENAAVSHYESMGYRAYRTENHIWRTLFGLLFWEILFDKTLASVHSPFDFIPSSLVKNTFYIDHKNIVEEMLQDLSSKPEIKLKLLKNCTKYYGTSNGIFRWRRNILPAINDLIDHSKPKSLAIVLRGICKDYKQSRYGYPDLLVVKNKRACFVEIKTEGDQLRQNQLLRLEQLKEAGLAAEVVRINWVLNPNQKYVVIDVETTGGRSNTHRVTEIGAVKVVNGEIVDRFETLLNPQRLISPKITKITNITNDMVKDAPLFSDIADKFESFISDSIFVAHNVNFDYGFISSEFSRIGRKLKLPKLCTCSSMRKLYPGHKSYSLANLTREYDIPLKAHHRALCDAEAAAHLLMMVNDRRLKSSKDIV